MGAIHRLPEELVHDVLSYALHIPLDDFFLVDTETDDAETKPRLRTASPPPSAFLLVSKQWHRIGLPLLYASLALSSSGALHAVAAAVTADPRLGRAIRAVRLRGAYGPALYTILRAAPQLRALSIATTAAAEDSLAGLRRAVPALDPRVLCVYSPLGGRGGWNAKRCQLDALLQSAVRTWRNLVRRRPFLSQ
ncbi:hypothetical protein PsYK624_080370 [Phanerochaete sordida]|uniref:F-box domain-containing protein n=1 Tax=Phanerochaete sordida TaxID=48140 RepID=A0A9P3LDV2_9APHY|nr:hypothetical protein PsYK624_080370 [Phanerochaete sordida]